MPLFQGFPSSTSGEESTCLCRRRKRHRLDPWVGKIPGGGHGNSFLYSCLENSMERNMAVSRARGHKESDLTEHTHTAFVSNHGSLASHHSHFWLSPIFPEKKFLKCEKNKTQSTDISSVWSLFQTLIGQFFRSDRCQGSFYNSPKQLWWKIFCPIW